VQWLFLPISHHPSQADKAIKKDFMMALRFLLLKVTGMCKRAASVLTVLPALCAVLVCVQAADGNGGKTQHYAWTQTLGDLSVNIPVPPGTKSRDIVCTISRQHLKAGLRGQPPIVDVRSRLLVRLNDS
jgi:CS domain